MGVLFILIAGTLQNANAFGVSSPYWQGNPVIMYPGETKIVNLNLQNNIGEDDVFVKVSILEGQDIARVEKELYFEYIANVLREPSYISGEYVLSNEGLIPESVFSITSITRKTTRKYQNFLGSFIYKNIKSELFLGFIEKKWLDKTIYIASKAKALFDYFYLKRMDNIRTSVLDARINWDSFAGGDINEFGKYVKLSGSKKMLRVLKNIKENYVSF